MNIYLLKAPLFYVAITKLRKTFIIYKKYNQSVFVDELADLLDISCEICNSSMNYNSDYDFFGCSKFITKNCEYTINYDDDRYNVMKRLIRTDNQRRLKTRLSKKYKSSRKHTKFNSFSIDCNI